nr:hypothetical protein DMOBY_02160 [Dehalococcoides mccartyi]
MVLSLFLYELTKAQPLCQISSEYGPNKKLSLKIVGFAVIFIQRLYSIGGYKISASITKIYYIPKNY